MIETDIELVTKAQQGEKTAMVTLLQKYRSIVAQKARLYYLTGGDQEDLIQEGMIALMQAVWDYNSERGSSFKSFASLCVENRIKTVVRQANRPKYSPLNDSVSLFEPVLGEEPDMMLMDKLSEDKNYDPVETLVSQEAVEQIMTTARTELSALERQVLYYYLQGDSHRVIAQKIDRTEKAVDNALQRIRKKI